MYSFGHGVQLDYAEAMRWLEKAADQGHAMAQFGLGNMFLNGQGVPQDIVRAYAWFSLSELLARSMTLAQKTKAERLAREWKSRKQSGATPSEFMIGDLDSALAAFRGGDYATAIQLFRRLPSEVTQVPNFISDLCTLTPAVSPRITQRL